MYIEGRELYVGVLGNNRLRALPVWELQFGSLGGQGARQIATEKAKHDTDYQERVGIVDGPADDLALDVVARLQRTAKRIYRILGLDGYARIDFRLAADGTPYFIEANPNPEIASSQEFAKAALHDGIDYTSLLQRILALAISNPLRFNQSLALLIQVFVCSAYSAIADTGDGRNLLWTLWLTEQVRSHVDACSGNGQRGTTSEVTNG